MNISIELIDADLSHVRQEKVDEIKESIKQIGLLHPITVRKNNDRYDLIAGKSRLKAIKDLGNDSIEVHIENSEVSPLEIVIHENLRRSNLEWHEQVTLEEELHNLRQEQHGKKRTGRGAASAPGWSQVDTARELGVALGSMSQDLFLASALKKNPHLKNIKDKNTALRLAKDTAKREHIEIETLAPDLMEMDQVFNGDSFEILQEIPDETFDVCLTDPPWIEFREKDLVRDENTIKVFAEVFRVLKRDSLLYAFVSTPDFHYYFYALRELNFNVQEFPLIWNKKGVMTHGRMAWQYGRTYEPILLAAKGRPALTQGTQMDPILEFAPVFPTKLIHPNEKPVGLMQELLKHSTFNGARVLDPFAGSGSTLVAAKSLGRKYIGVERQYKYYEQIEKRLSRLNGENLG